VQLCNCIFNRGHVKHGLAGGQTAASPTVLVTMESVRLPEGLSAQAEAKVKHGIATALTLLLGDVDDVVTVRVGGSQFFGHTCSVDPLRARLRAAARVVVVCLVLRRST